MSRYYFDTAEDVERARLEARCALWDPFTFRMLDEVGIGDGRRCLEIGAATGSVAIWLLEKVGKRGHVVATDIETRRLEPLGGPNLEVRRHDVTVDPIEESAYDLVHVRLVLMHLPERDRVVARLVAALRPGGWLIVHDYDVTTLTIAHPADATWTKVFDMVLDVLRSHGADVAYGRKLATALRSAGLADVTAEGLLLPWPAPELAPVYMSALDRMRDELLDTYGVSAAEFDQVMSQIGDGCSLSAYSPTLVSARGRRRWSEVATTEKGGPRCMRPR